MTIEDTGRIVALDPRRPALDARCERAVETTRVLTALPVRLLPLPKDGHAAAMVEFLASRPASEPVLIHAQCPAPGEQPRVYVTGRSLIANAASEASIARGLDALLAWLWPEATFAEMCGSIPPLRFAARVRPAARPARPPATAAARPRLLTAAVPTDHIVIERLARRGFDVAAALSVLVYHAPSELSLCISPWAAPAQTLRALESFDLRRLGTPAENTDASPDDAALGAFVSALRASGRGVRIDAEVRFAAEPDPTIIDLVCAALYGAPAGRAEPNGLDLRSLWPVGWPLPRLLPDDLDVRRIRDRVRPSRASREQESGSVLLGRCVASQEEVVLVPRDRARHLFCLGATGAGKSTLLLNLIMQDMRGKDAVLLIDPHGDLADAARKLVPEHRRADLIWSDVSDPTSVLGLNILQGQGGRPELERNFVCNQLISLFRDVLYRNVPEAFGPMFETYFRNALMMLMSADGPEASLMDFERVFHDDRYRATLLANCPDQKVREFWKYIAERVDHSEIRLENVAPYIVCKLAQITGNPLVRRMIEARKSELDLRAAMDNGHIVLIKLAKGLIGEYDTTLIASLLAIRIAQAGMARATLPEDQRRPARLYIDEFQNCTGESLSNMLAECRKYGISLTLANQSLSQVDGRGRHNDAGDAALANAANLLVCRVGAPDAARLAPWFEPHLPWPDLCRLPDFHAAVRVLDNGRPAPIETIRLASPPVADVPR